MSNLQKKVGETGQKGMKLNASVDFAVVSIVLLGIICVTSVVFLAYQQTEPIVTNIMTQFGVPAAQQQVQANLGNNIYQFDTFIPLIAYMVFLCVCLSVALLSVDPLSWLIGILMIPINFYIAGWISNIGHMILTQAILVNGVSRLPQSISLLANLQTIVLLFSVLYIVCLAIRVYFFNPSGRTVTGTQKLV